MLLRKGKLRAGLLLKGVGGSAVIRCRKYILTVYCSINLILMSLINLFNSLIYLIDCF